MQKTLAFFFLAVAVMLAACKFNPDMQTPGENYLQGEWQQDTTALQKQMVTYSLYRFKFSCDSFFVSMRTFTRGGINTDSCVHNGQWAEYAKGSYTQKKDTLSLKGLFCNADFSYKSEGGCFRWGRYEETFTVSKKTDSLLQFSPASSVLPFNARLIKRTTCNPKPL